MARAFEGERINWCLLLQCALCIVLTVAGAALAALALYFVGIPVFGAVRDFSGAGDSFLPP